MASGGAAVTIEDLKVYHEIDREVYCRLVIDLNVDLMQGMEMISMWLWMEQVGYSNLILKMVDIPNDALKGLADEAIACLRVIASQAVPPQTNRLALTMTQALLEEDQFIDLDFFDTNRDRASFQIYRYVDGFCQCVFDDIVQQVLSNITGPVLFRNFIPIVIRNASILPTQGTSSRVYHGLGGTTTFEMGESSSPARPTLNPMAAPYNPITNELLVGEEPIPADERTLFITFSRGYPIPENDVLEFFVRNWGDCVENIIMQKVEKKHIYQQPLYAKLVLKSAYQMYDILEGNQRRKFNINGRHIQVRRYEA